MELIDKDLEEYKIPRCEAETLAQDRMAWRNLISHGMSAHADVNYSWWWWFTKEYVWYHKLSSVCVYISVCLSIGCCTGGQCLL